MIPAAMGNFQLHLHPQHPEILQFPPNIVNRGTRAARMTMTMVRIGIGEGHPLTLPCVCECILQLLGYSTKKCQKALPYL